MGFSGRGKNELKYKKSIGAYCNSTESIRCYTYAGYSYKEAVVVIKEFKTKHGIKTFKFVNCTHWSVTTSQHHWPINSFRGYNRHDIEINLDFCGSMNFLIDAKKFSIDLFSDCKFSESLTKFINEYFSKTAAKKFLIAKEKSHNESILAAKKSASKDRLQNNLSNLNYSNEKTLKAAFDKYGLENFKRGLKIRASNENIEKFYSVIIELDLANTIQSASSDFFTKLNDLKTKLVIFGNLDQNNNLTEAV